MLLATAVATHAEDAPLLRSLPTEVQGEIEGVRARCPEYIDSVKGIDSVEGSDYTPQVVTSGDGGLIQFTLSGAQAVMVDDVELCGGASFKGVNYSNRGSHSVVVYVRSRNSWRKILSTDAGEKVFLSVDDNSGFKALVMSVLGGNKGCPTRPVLVREGGKSHVYQSWKHYCDVVVRWDGTGFTYRPL
jgi:hypothetical protein